MNLKLEDIPPGWFLINLFHDVQGRTGSHWYCRLRHGPDPADKEVTVQGDSPEMALEGACNAALVS